MGKALQDKCVAKNEEEEDGGGGIGDEKNHESMKNGLFFWRCVFGNWKFHSIETHRRWQKNERICNKNNSWREE